MLKRNNILLACYMISLYLRTLAFGQSDSQAGLVAAYAFNEGTGSIVSDASGNGNTGQIYGATWTTNGRFGDALSLNGTSSYVDLGTPSSLKTTGSMTWSAWVMASGIPPDDGQIVAKSDGTAGWQLKTSPDTGPRTFGVAVSANASNHTQRYSRTVLALNTWYYVTGVYNAVAQTLDIYVNGVQDDGVLSGSVPASQSVPNVDATIGERSGGYYFNGVIDELRIYNRALSQAEIQNDMNTPVGGQVAAYAFNEGTGSIVSDASGNGNTGQIYGAIWTTNGRFGDALSFNGTSSYVDLGTPSSLKTTGSMTWSAWVMSSGNPPDDGQIVAQSDGTNGWQLKTSPDTGPRTFGVAVSANGSNHIQRYSRTVLALNTWYYVTGVYNAVAQTLDIYVNGVQDDGVLSGTVPASQSVPNVDATIGERSGGYYFNGVIDELRIYNRALSQAEIQNDMNTPVGGLVPLTLTFLQCNPSSVVSGSASTCTVTLNEPAPSATTVSLSDNNSNLTEPPSVTIPAGTAMANFTAITGTVTSTQTAVITAQLGSSSQTATLTLLPTLPNSHSVSLSWTASISPNVVGYDVYRATTSGGPYTQLNSTLVAATSYTDTTVVAGQTYYYVGRAVDNYNNESVYSNEAQATVPFP